MDRNITSATVIAVPVVALRKESVDRNLVLISTGLILTGSLSARRAWIEIALVETALRAVYRRSPQGERG